jgi:23S rRNA (cytosine1962-C5)-methyltransferase
MLRNALAVLVTSCCLAGNAFAHDEEHDLSHSAAKVTAHGRAADPAQAQRTIVVEMRDPYQFVPREIEVHEHGVRYLAAPWTGQKTGAFLDQREARVRAGTYARGRALDCFSYHGSFALHLARNADHVTAIDSSRAALERAAQNAERNRLTNIECVEANAFDYLREQERQGEAFDTIVLDPPAFAKPDRP